MPMTPEILLSLEPEELGAHMLLALQHIAERHDGIVHSTNQYREVLGTLFGIDPPDTSTRSVTRQAFTEAWAWLEAQGLLVPASSQASGSGFRALSRRALRFESVADFIPFRIGRMLDRDMLNPRIREEVWAAFIRQHFTVGAGIAMQAVETAVREACGPMHDKAGKEQFGKALMGRAFDPTNGPLTDPALPFPEQEGVRDLFTGAIAAHRNPLAHGKVTLDDAAEVIEVVLLANHLLRIVDRAVARNTAAQAGRVASISAAGQ